MSKTTFLLKLDELLELEPGTLAGAETLEGVGWDSLMVVGFIALADEEYGISVSPAKLSKCETPEELFNLVQAEHKTATV